MYKVQLLKDAQEYLDSLVANHRAKALAIMARLALQGPMLHRPHSDAVRGKIRELRCGMATFEHRFLFFFDQKLIIITHGFLKKDDAIPEREIARAESVHRIYFSGRRSERNTSL